MIIGLTGYAGSGKDTVGKILVEKHGFKRLAFADKLKELALRLDPIVTVTDNDSIEAIDNTDIAAYHSYGAPITINDIVNVIGWDEAKKLPDVRQLLQELGTGLRDVLGKDVWIEAVEQEHWFTIDYAMPVSYITRLGGVPDENVVFTDVRFQNEADHIVSRGGHVIQVYRPGVGPVNDHVSENEIATQVFIDNDRSIEELEDQVANLVGFLDLRS